MLQDYPQVPQLEIPPRQLTQYQPAKPPRKSGTGWIGLVVVVFCAVMAFEYFIPRDFKFSAFVGSFIGNEEAAELRAKLEAAQATIAAQNEENARMQQEVERFRARTERVTLAYKSLYDRANIIAQSAMNLSQKYQEMRQEVVTQLEKGKTSAAVLGDLASIFGAIMGNQDLANNAHAMAEKNREEVLRKFDEETKRGAAQMSASADDWKQGIPDPAAIIREERDNPITPEPRKPAPRKSIIYQDRPPSGARLARVNNKFQGVLVRSTPQGGKKAENKICVFPQLSLIHI